MTPTSKKIILDWLAKIVDDATEVSISNDRLVLKVNGETSGIIVHQRLVRRDY